jgi:HEAT repeat protein
MQATWTLGQVDERAGIASLRRALMDPARPVRLQAAWALATRLRGSAAGAQVGGG